MACFTDSDDIILSKEPKLTPICFPYSKQIDGTEPGDEVVVSGWYKQ